MVGLRTGARRPERTPCRSPGKSHTWPQLDDGQGNVVILSVRRDTGHGVRRLVGDTKHDGLVFHLGSQDWGITH